MSPQVKGGTLPIDQHRQEGQVWVRPLKHLTPSDLTVEMSDLGLSAEDARRFSHLSTGCAVRVEHVTMPLAQRLADAVRSAGGEAAIGTSPYTSDDDLSVDVVLLGSRAQLLQAADRFPDLALHQAVTAGEWRVGTLNLGHHRLDLSRRVAVMGILNVTPDSFFDGGRHQVPEAAIEHGLRLVAEGADLIDVGGDSAGGRAAPIDAAEEIRRVEPVIRGLARQVNVPIAIDTHRARTAAAALAAGASMVNDITGLGDSEMAGEVARAKAGLCLMHIKGVPKEFPPHFAYRSLLGDIIRFLAERTDRALQAGVQAESIVVDPGIEFGKLLHQDLEILRRLPELHILGYPILVAVSRKDFIGNVLDLPPEERLEGTAAAVTFSVMRGAHIVRVHDVKPMVRVVRMTEALMGYRPDGSWARQRSDGSLV
ncbi:MAG TPA: dihydropteroate synthase [Chloroflexota bacterium]|nr:dihydropteroate synthase [Chloroflexota bacterium]